MVAGLLADEADVGTGSRPSGDSALLGPAPDTEPIHRRPGRDEAVVMVVAQDVLGDGSARF